MHLYASIILFLSPILKRSFTICFKALKPLQAGDTAQLVNKVTCWGRVHRCYRGHWCCCYSQDIHGWSWALATAPATQGGCRCNGSVAAVGSIVAVPHHSPFSCSIDTTCLKPSRASRGSSPSSMPGRVQDNTRAADVDNQHTCSICQRASRQQCHNCIAVAACCVSLGSGIRRTRAIGATMMLLRTLGIVILVFDVNIFLFGLLVRVFKAIIC